MLPGHVSGPHDDLRIALHIYSLLHVSMQRIQQKA